MNRVQRERVEDIGRAFTEAVVTVLSDGPEEIGSEAYDMEDGPRMESGPTLSPELANVSMPNDRLVPFHVNIRQMHNGFIVEVGCQTFVFETFEKMSKYLKMYYADPKATMKKHEDGTLFSETEIIKG